MLKMYTTALSLNSDSTLDPNFAQLLRLGLLDQLAVARLEFGAEPPFPRIADDRLAVYDDYYPYCSSYVADDWKTYDLAPMPQDALDLVDVVLKRNEFDDLEIWTTKDGQAAMLVGARGTTETRENREAQYYYLAQWGQNFPATIAELRDAVQQQQKQQARQKQKDAMAGWAYMITIIVTSVLTVLLGDDLWHFMRSLFD